MLASHVIARSASVIAVLLVSVAAAGQQSNSANHAMTINAVDGPPYPIATNEVRTNTTAVIAVTGVANQPYAIYESGALAAGVATAFGGSVDIAITPPPALPIDGFANPAFRTDLTGHGVIPVAVPGAGTPPAGVPLGLQRALQTVIADPFASSGLSLTAATRVTVIQGPTVTYYSLGDEYEQPVSFPSTPLPFYGVNYSTVFVGSNGYVCFGTSLGSDPTASPQDMLSGPPRIAAQWCDLQCPPNTVKVTYDPNPGSGAPAYLRVDYLGILDWLAPISHDLSILIRADGYVEIASGPSNNAAHFDQMTGIAPGFGMGGLGQGQKNFLGPQPLGSAVGPGILSTPPYALVGGPNEAFYEWFGITSLNLAYLQSYDNPYDLIGTTLRFMPSGQGVLPASTIQYTAY
jgi:hypothetical protein